ncbi:MAG: amidohydrolase family protein [Calditrichia bacterium]
MLLCKNLYIVVMYVIMFSLLFFCSSNPPATFDLIITNVNLIDGTGNPLQSGMNVLIQNGKIRAITKISSQQTTNRIDGTGKYLMPGLFDGHVHTTDFQKTFPKLMHYGVTSVFVPGGSTCSVEFYTGMRAMGSQDSIPAPRVFHTSQHFTMEGKHPVKTYANSNWVKDKTVFFLTDTLQIKQVVQLVAQQPIQGIKLTIEDGPAPPFVERIPQEFVDAVVREAAKHDLPVYAHASDNEEFLMAIKGGAKNHVHFVGIDIDWNNEEHITAMETVRDRNGSIITTLMIDKSFIYPLHPEWLEIPEFNAVYPFKELQTMLTPKNIRFAKMMAEMTKRDYGLDTLTMEALFSPKVEDIQRALDMGVNMVLGTDTGNRFIFHGYSLHEEMQILEEGGMVPMDIIRMGTINAARMLNAEDSLGTLQTGKLADMILLNKNPLESIRNTLEIESVFKNGKVQHRFER